MVNSANLITPPSIEKNLCALSKSNKVMQQNERRSQGRLGAARRHSGSVAHVVNGGIVGETSLAPTRLVGCLESNGS